MSTTIAHSIELPLGYSVVDRLGAGGYGEVWKATAPGGVEKAIKIVYGHCDEGMAERELKSLDRIKSVRHPFVLSIERYEIVNNRLVIVTELADMSLSDCFKKYRSEGRVGIPRDELIAYMWDAAEALDCLVEQHSLQHLDIKPENLLMVGDHIKVADFGLVKELASKTLNSMMGGMTPLYSAPEIYDDNPSSRSDQYSLAIVYQHMLTGSLPFPGHTPAQLAKQHTLSEPNLHQLNEVDRQAVGKALEKDPTARFSSCRDFVNALRSGVQTSFARTRILFDHKGSQPTTETKNDDTKSTALLDTKPMEESEGTAATMVLSEIKRPNDLSNPTKEEKPARPSPRLFPRVDSTIEEIEIPDCEHSTATASVPTLFVGVGGIGVTMLRAIRNRANAHDPEGVNALAWLRIDTERESLKDVLEGEYQDSLACEEKLHIPLRRPNQYREESQNLLRWVSRRWLYNIPRSLQTRGFRPLGRIAIVDHAEAVFAVLQKQIHWLAQHDHSQAGLPRPIRVVLLAGMSGGTGSGTIIDLAQAVRSVCQEFSQEVVIHGVLGSTFHTGSTDSLAAANMYSLLTELTHTQIHGNCGESPPPGPASRYELSQRPFDEIFTVAIPTRSDRAVGDLTLQSIADYLLLEASGSTGPVLNVVRSTKEEVAERISLRTFSCINLGQLANSYRSLHQQHLIKALVDYWLIHRSENADNDAKCFAHYANSQFAHAILAHFPKPTASAEDTPDEATSSNQRKIRTAKIKCIADAFVQFIETFELQNENDQPAIESTEVRSACDRIVATLFTILRGNELPGLELSQKISELLTEQAREMAEFSSVADPTQLAASALSLLDGGPLNCGYRRRTMLITPSDQHDSALSDAFSEACPSLANFQAAVAETYLLREGSQLHPLHLGARLAEDYPDVDEAASRLHTRNDINWHELRSLS